MFPRTTHKKYTVRSFQSIFSYGQAVWFVAHNSPAATVRLKALLEVTRPANAVFAGVATALGAFIGGFSVFPGVLAALVTAMATAGGNAVNDYYDADIDEVNRPERPIPSGRLRRREAVLLAALLLAAAFALTLLFLPPLAIAIGVVNLFVLVGYSSHLKRTPFLGNLAVAFLTGTAFLFGGAAVGGAEFTAALFLLAALATLGREIVKDVEDVEGDKRMGASTLPLVWGERNSLVAASGFVVAAVMLSPAPYLLGQFGLPYLVAVLPADLVLLAGVVRIWGSASQGQKLLKLGMFVAMLAFLAARITTELSH